MNRKRKNRKKRMLAGVLGAALLCTSLSAVGFAQTGVFSGEEDYTQYVDPFVATQVDNGQQFLGGGISVWDREAEPGYLSAYK